MGGGEGKADMEGGMEGGGREEVGGSEGDKSEGNNQLPTSNGSHQKPQRPENGSSPCTQLVLLTEKQKHKNKLKKHCSLM